MITVGLTHFGALGAEVSEQKPDKNTQDAIVIKIVAL
jgi:hypothetical protein